MSKPVYILIRTSRRRAMFNRAMASIKAQTYPNIKTIVHTDDPRDGYVTGDIIIKGHKYPRSIGAAPYNLYCNRLLEAVPDVDGWFCFLDDDDEYTAPDVIERLVSESKPDCVNVGKVLRWSASIYPEHWGKRISKRGFQTECFFLHTKHRELGKWWANRGGDHYYTRFLTQLLEVNWIENLLIAKSQNGKNSGKTFDKMSNKISNFVSVLALCPINKGRPDYIRQEEIGILDFSQALELEKSGKVEITYPGILKNNLPVRRVFKI